MADIELERRGPVAIVAINRPAKRNALDGRAWRQLGAIFEAFGSDPDLRAVVLTGRGGAFCAGDEIGAFAAVRDDPAARREYWDGIMACYAAVSAVPVPVVAAVSGPCVGGGCTLALRADFRIADGTARFGVPPAKLGFQRQHHDAGRRAQPCRYQQREEDDGHDDERIALAKWLGAGYHVTDRYVADDA